MYTDLAEAVEDLNKRGYDNLFEPDDNAFYCSRLDLREKVPNMMIVETWQFDQGTDPGDESTIYALETKDGIKGYIIISFGTHIDPRKANLIDQLIKSQE
ncbi:MAG: hypothetical protein LC662_08565 [Rhodothermaceae bacterium]|nr:hypothetical protein [Rhodothermaceae bacterium]